jgi:hypothetical protein
VTIFIAILMSVISFGFGVFHHAKNIMRLDKSGFVKYIFARDMVRKKIGLEPFRDFIGLHCKCGCDYQKEIK